MSTNKTTNYQLHLWEPGDDFLREEFNENNEMIDAVIAAGVKIATGSYVGTGTYGTSDPVTIALDFDPKALWIFQNNYDSGAFVKYGGTQFAPSSNSIRYFFKGGSAVLAYTYVSGSGYQDTYLYYTMENNTFSCYNAYDAAAQMNTSGTTYYYIAIG